MSAVSYLEYMRRLCLGSARMMKLIRVQGHLDTYRFCDEVWTFLIKDVTFKMENATVHADKVKIVSCGTKKE